MAEHRIEHWPDFCALCGLARARGGRDGDVLVGFDALPLGVHVENGGVLRVESLGRGGGDEVAIQAAIDLAGAPIRSGG